MTTRSRVGRKCDPSVALVKASLAKRNKLCLSDEEESENDLESSPSITRSSKTTKQSRVVASHDSASQSTRCLLQTCSKLQTSQKSIEETLNIILRRFDEFVASNEELLEEIKLLRRENKIMRKTLSNISEDVAEIQQNLNGLTKPCDMMRDDPISDIMSD